MSWKGPEPLWRPVPAVDALIRQAIATEESGPLITLTGTIHAPIAIVTLQWIHRCFMGDPGTNVDLWSRDG